MNQLKKISLSGFKSIKHVELHLRQLNVLIGANGAGKSNFISFFRLLNWMTFDSNLQTYIEQKGSARDFLYYGPETTRNVTAHLQFQSDTGLNEYDFELLYSQADRFFFGHERIRYSTNIEQNGVARWINLGDGGHRESKILDWVAQENPTAKYINHLLRQCVVYQFHDTSDTARVKQWWNSDDWWYLRDDAANLAPVLYRLQQGKPRYYGRIIKTLRSILPFFIDFDLNVNPHNNKIKLQWREKGPDMLFSAHQASDGTLRIMALVTLLMQPPEWMPSLIVLDEPELGLHPYAIGVLARLIHAASSSTQIILATQSAPFIDYFEPEDIITVERDSSERQEYPTVFHRLDSDTLEDWLDAYALSELWEKNVVGGNPQ